MSCGQIGEFLSKLVADALLLQNVHQQIVQVAIEHISSNGIDFVIPLALVDGHLINGKHIIVLSLLCLSLQIGASKRKGGATSNNIHFELGLAAHFTQFRLVGIWIDFRLLLAVNCVVHIEAYDNLFLVRLLGQLHIGASQLYAKSFQCAGNSFALLHLTLRNDLLGEKLDKFTFTY